MVLIVDMPTASIIQRIHHDGHADDERRTLLHNQSPGALFAMKKIIVSLWICLAWFTSVLSEQIKMSSFTELIADNGQSFETFFHTPPSVTKWENVENPKHFTVLSMNIDHSVESKWFFKHLHSRHSIGWNRTHLQREYGTKPHACSVRFYGIGLEKTLDGYQHGGTGFLTIAFKDDHKKQYWHGFDKNETNRLHCYYGTNKDTGSEFLDKPKTLGIAINCPVSMDDEVGPFLHNRKMETGYYCRPLSEYEAEIELHLRPTEFTEENPVRNEIFSEFYTPPGVQRTLKIREEVLTNYRPHAVCTVQTFKNQFTGPMMYFFIAYYQLMGWKVIVYDRFGLHYEYVKELLRLPGVDYYPFTVHQLSQPSKYNKKYREQQGEELKSFYKMEVNWGYSSKKIADTPDQDADKSRTYDYARVEYSHLDTILYIDADELLFCPQAEGSIESQRKYQQTIHSEFRAKGIEEMRYVRIPYSGIAPPGFINNAANRSSTDFTNHTGTCMIHAYNERSLQKLASCWSSGTSYDNFPKSADLAGVCPFHYNHWSCDGMKGGGRDWTKNRCRCKVGLDMQNFYDYRPVLKKCHLMHFNDNKYRFQSKRTKHTYDKGDVTIPSPLVALLAKTP